jgi:hypothetical protein
MINSSNLASTTALNDRSIQNHQTGVELVNLLDCWCWFVCCCILCGERCGTFHVSILRRHFWFTHCNRQAGLTNTKNSPHDTNQTFELVITTSFYLLLICSQSWKKMRDKCGRNEGARSTRLKNDQKQKLIV